MNNIDILSLYRRYTHVFSNSFEDLQINEQVFEGFTVTTLQKINNYVIFLEKLEDCMNYNSFCREKIEPIYHSNFEQFVIELRDLLEQEIMFDANMIENIAENHAREVMENLAQIG